jgi:hypothetical protein
MQSDSLHLTKRGIFITHWAIELMAGLLIFLMISGMFMFSQPNIAMPMLNISSFLTTWAYPCLQIALVIGIMLTMAAPKASGVAPWAELARLNGIRYRSFCTSDSLYHHAFEFGQVDS